MREGESEGGIVMSRSMPHGSAPDQMGRPDGARNSRGSRVAIVRPLQESRDLPGAAARSVTRPCYLRTSSYSHNVPLQDEQRKRRSSCYLSSLTSGKIKDAFSMSSFTGKAETADHVICNLTTNNSEISMRIRVERGRGYVPASSRLSAWYLFLTINLCPFSASKNAG